MRLRQDLTMLLDITMHWAHCAAYVCISDMSVMKASEFYSDQHLSLHPIAICASPAPREHAGCMLHCLTTDMPIYAVTFRLAVACGDDPTWFVFVNTSNMDIWGSYMCLDVFLGFRRCQNHPNTPPFDFWSLNCLIWQPVRGCWGRLREIRLWLSWGPRKFKISS